MKITFYTVDEFMEELIEPENFWARIKILDFMPTVIATWDHNEKEQKEFDEWWKDFEDMEGCISRPYVCQLEFENEVDAMHFKLRWT